MLWSCELNEWLKWLGRCGIHSPNQDKNSLVGKFIVKMYNVIVLHMNLESIMYIFHIVDVERMIKILVLN